MMTAMARKMTAVAMLRNRWKWLKERETFLAPSLAFCMTRAMQSTGNAAPAAKATGRKSPADVAAERGISTPK